MQTYQCKKDEQVIISWALHNPEPRPQTDRHEQGCQNREDGGNWENPHIQSDLSAKLPSPSKNMPNVQVEMPFERHA